MRALFNIAGGHGHLYPLVPLARALDEVGVEVAVATPAWGVEHVRQVGLTPIPLDAPGVAPPGDAYKAGQATSPPLERARTAIRRYLDQAVLQTPALTEVATDWRADVIVRETTSLAGWLAGELLDLPVAVFDFAPTPAKVRAITTGDLHADARDRVGLPADPGLSSLTRWLHLVALPPDWLPRGVVGPTTHLLQPPPDPTTDLPAPAWLARQDSSRPLAYVTLGTFYNRTPGVFEAIFEALSDEPLDVLATVGPDVDPALFASLPSHIRVARFVPQALVVPLADVVICHAGYGALMSSLRHGRPIVTVPLASADHLSNAARVQALGAGAVVPAEDRTPTAIRTAVRSVLGEPRYRETAKRIAHDIADLPPFCSAADLVIELAAERAPVHNVR